MGADELAGQGGGLLASSAKVSDPAARSPVQKQEMPARGSSGGPGRTDDGACARRAARAACVTRWVGPKPSDGC